MKYAICILCVLIGAATSVLSQDQRKINGVFKGGICADGSICGYWVIKPDSQFVFINFEEGYLRHVGSGDWYVSGDTLINFQFKEDQFGILEQTQIQYASMTGGSFDSLYIAGRIYDENHSPMPFTSVIFNSRLQALSDAEGKFKMTASRSLHTDIDHLVVINKLMGYEITKVQLHKGHNQHNIEIQLARFNPAFCVPAYDKDSLMGRLLSGDKPFQLKFEGNSKKKSSASIARSDVSVSMIIEELETIKSLQPSMSLNIERLINVIRP